jgi:hypothetical protein
LRAQIFALHHPSNGQVPARKTPDMSPVPNLPIAANKDHQPPLPEWRQYSLTLSLGPVTDRSSDEPDRGLL